MTVFCCFKVDTAMDGLVPSMKQLSSAENTPIKLSHPGKKINKQR